MANKQSDPIQALAANIVNTMNSVATCRSNKASFDKSYYTTVSGINRKFIMDVPADEQAAIIQKYNIPVTLADGENNYYTFKINGVYYCLQQNGDFKLYDNIMVYVPNGDWSRMYIDYPIYIKEDTHIPMPFVSETEPEEGMVEGDYWDKVDSNGDILAVYIYQPNEITGELEWSQLFSVATSDGVGENIGRHNERHNHYDNYEWGYLQLGNGMDDASYQKGSDYNSFRNYENRVIDSLAYASDFSGYGNQLLATNPETGTPTPGMAYAADMGGMDNKMRGRATGCFIRGQLNTTSNAPYSGIIGERNTIIDYGNSHGDGAYASFTTGVNNLVTHYCAVALGDSNKATSTSSVALGYRADTSQAKIFAVGNGPTGNVLTIGASYRDHCYAYGYDTYGADYAEYFEWDDGNPNDEDRRGKLVTPKGNKIVYANGSSFLGAISSQPSVVGNTYESYWHGKYATDVFGCPILDKNGYPLISPDFDPSQEYVPRSQRSEWDIVGLIGCIIIIDDGTCQVGGYVAARDGIGTLSVIETPATVLSRIDDRHIKILLVH